MIALILLSLLGLILSFYAHRVEQNLKKKAYTPLCDINDHVSCSKAFASPYGHVFGLSNAFFGLFFYIGMLVLLFFDARLWLFIGAFVSVLGSLYLAYASYVKIKTFCLVCTSIYVINILLLIFSTRFFFLA